jgi:hypothetical protein
MVILVGGRGGTRTLKAVKPADFKSTAYTNSATRPRYRNVNGGTYRVRTGVRGFADRCVTTPPRRLTQEIVANAADYC